MTIRINDDSIELGGVTLSETSDGFAFGGKISASELIDRDFLAFQGQLSGYTSGGNPGAPETTNIIDKFPLQLILLLQTLQI